jgi:MFS transporter, YNFM family, putative membrane transport protein
MCALEIADARSSDSGYIAAGTAVFWRANVALFSAAFSTFALLYCIQPLLPVLSKAFQVSPTLSSLSLSIPTAGLGIGIVLASSVSEVIGRKTIMFWSLGVSSLLALAAAAAPTWILFLGARALAGIALSGLPAVAMAYVSEEFHPKAGGLAMGLYIGGTGLGGMTGRLMAAFLTDELSWRWALGTIGGIALFSCALFWLCLPVSRHFVPHEPVVSRLVETAMRHLKDPGLLRLYFVGFLIMGANVSLFNYIGFRLVDPPYRLSQSAVGLVFLVYLLGVASSPWSGAIAGRRASSDVLLLTLMILLGGVIVSLAHPLWMVIAAFGAISFGFFGAHTVASAWIGRRVREGKALASSLYLFFYYAGASILGTVTGKAWTGLGWIGVAASIAGAIAVALIISWSLRGLPKVDRTVEPDLAHSDEFF